MAQLVCHLSMLLQPYLKPVTIEHYYGSLLVIQFPEVLPVFVRGNLLLVGSTLKPDTRVSAC